MEVSENHFTFCWTIQSKPGGGFVARSQNPEETIEAASREEIEAAIRDKLAASLGPQLSAKLDLAKLDLHSSGNHFTTHIDKKFSFTLKKPGEVAGDANTATPAQIESAPPAPIDAAASSNSLWKFVALAAIAVIIWLLLRR